MLISCFKGRFRLTSPRGYRYLNGVKDYHKGIDLVGIDTTEVTSVSEGTVLTAYQANGAGNYVVVTMNDGRRVYYMHLASFKVKTGDYVLINDPIGIMGNTGNSFGAHTHLEIRPKGSTSESDDICEFTDIPNKVGVYSYDPNMVYVDKLYDVGLITDKEYWSNSDDNVQFGPFMTMLDRATYGSYVDASLVFSNVYDKVMTSLYNKKIITDVSQWNNYDADLPYSLCVAALDKACTIYNKPLLRNISLQNVHWSSANLQNLVNRYIITDYKNLNCVNVLEGYTSRYAVMSYIYNGFVR